VTGARDAVSVAAPELVRRGEGGVGHSGRRRAWACGPAEQAAEIGAFADGVSWGSALVSALKDGIPAVRSLTAELADGVRQRITA
jgi:tryptophan synthase alpha chain